MAIDCRLARHGDEPPAYAAVFLTPCKTAPQVLTPMTPYRRTIRPDD